jgi:hypothetical protein
VSVNPISPDVFQGGQMTDLPEFTGTLDGTELMEVVAAPSGQTNEAGGVNYSITTELLAQLLINLAITAVIISDGEYETPGDPYIVQPTDGRIYINKTVPAPTYVLMPLASTMLNEPLVRDIAGTVNDTTAIVTVDFTGGELADGNASVPVQSPYGGYFFRPVSTLAKWTLGVG